MDERRLFVLADKSLLDVVQQIKDDQWDMTMPDDFARRDTGKVPTLRETINYHAYDEAWVPDILSGKTMDEVGRNKIDGDLLGDSPKQTYAELVDKAVAAVESLDDLDRKVHLTYGEWPARDYLQHISYFRGLRVYDIAKAIGANTTMPHDLVKALWEVLQPHAEDWRKMGVFKAEVKVSDGADLQDRLLGLTGRQPLHS